MTKETAIILDEMRKTMGYVQQHDPECYYEDTIKRALACKDTLKDGVKFFKKKVKVFAGPFNYYELWILHNVLIDLQERTNWFLVREKGNDNKFKNLWNILIALDDQRTN
jgi:hypothetical protein